MSSKLHPRLSDIRLSYELIARSTYDISLLDDRAYRALVALVAHSAAGMVWTYSPPGDGSIPDDDERLARIVGLLPQQWRRIRPSIQPFFKAKGGKWYLDRPWIEIDGVVGRVAIPSAMRDTVSAREGRLCTYCGDTNGPFDHDHIFPVSRGGLNDPSNLTLACASCNRSKGAKTLREWVCR